MVSRQDCADSGMSFRNSASAGVGMITLAFSAESTRSREVMDAGRPGRTRKAFKNDASTATVFLISSSNKIPLPLGHERSECKPDRAQPVNKYLGEGRIRVLTSTLTRRAFAPLIARRPLPVGEAISSELPPMTCHRVE